MSNSRRHPSCGPSGWLGSSGAALAILSLLMAVPAQAARFEAICGDSRCRIEISESGFAGPAGLIPANRIAQWNALGWKNHNALVSSLGATGGAVTGTVVGALASCWTLVACPFGILAGAVIGGVAGSRAGKTADYRFSVEGYDASGRKLTETFRFINAEPVPDLVETLTRVSGLEMGEQREVAISAPQPPAPRPSRPAPARTPTPAVRRPQAPAPVPAPLPMAAPPLGLTESPTLQDPQPEMPILYDAIDPYQGTPLFP
jgi:hypothetical protein